MLAVEDVIFDDRQVIAFFHNHQELRPLTYRPHRLLHEVRSQNDGSRSRSYFPCEKHVLSMLDNQPQAARNRKNKTCKRNCEQISARNGWFDPASPKASNHDNPVQAAHNFLFILLLRPASTFEDYCWRRSHYFNQFTTTFVFCQGRIIKSLKHFDLPTVIAMILI